MKFNKNEFGWKEKVSVNTDELVTKNDIPHYNETLMFEISGEDFGYFMNNNYFNMNALNIDETKSYVGKEINSEYDSFDYKFVYDKEADALMDEDSQMYIYNHKSYDGENFIEDVDSAVMTFGITPMTMTPEYDGYFRLYEIEKLELDTNCLPDNVSIPNSLTVGTRIGDIGIYSVAEGDGLIASGNCSHAEGNYTEAIGNISHAEGGNTTASGDWSHAEGFLTTASGNASHAEGNNTMASGHKSHAEGGSTKASGEYSHAEGMETKAIGHKSHAEGYYSTALGECSHAEGFSNSTANKQITNLSTTTSNTTIINAWKRVKFSLAKSNYSHVEGDSCLALDECSHAEGNRTIASNSYCHSEGDSTKATGNTSHAEGYKTEAMGDYSHVEGYSTIASGENSHAEGYYTKASGQQQHVQGKYNIVDTSYAHIVGNGSSETSRSNAHTLDWNGNAWYAGKLTQDGVPTEDKDLATKKYVDDSSQLNWMEYYEIAGTKVKAVKVDVATLEKGKFYAFNYKKYPDVRNVMIVKKYDDDTTKTIITFTKVLEYIYFGVLGTTFIAYIKYSTGSSSMIKGIFGSTASEYTSTLTPTVLDTQSNKEFTPTKDYHPATKIYVDDKFLTDDYEDLFTLTQEEMDSANNGGRGLVLDKISMLNGSEFNSKYLYCGYYQDEIIRLIYNESANYFYCDGMDTTENGTSIGLAIDVGASSVMLIDGGMDDVKAYNFKGDLIVKKRLIINPNDVATKKYVDDVIASQPQISFDTEGNLVVTIGGVTKKFKEITE